MDYTQNVFFGPKDALPPGDPAKRIKGSEMDAELAEISSALASKEDESSKGAADGYAGLNSDGVVPAAQLPDATETAQGISELATTAEVVTGTDTTRTVTPAGVKAAIDALRAEGSGGVGDLAGLADPGADRILFWDESADAWKVLIPGSGLTITDVTIAFSGDASLLTSGTIPDARVPASAVTQHNGSLQIAESQITDGTILARVGSTETITGAWNFTTAPSIGGLEIGYRRVPKSTTTSGVLTAAECGKCIPATAGVTINPSVFAAGDAVSIYNDSASSITITQGSLMTLRLAGTATTGNRTLAARGLVTIWFNSASEAVLTGSGVA